MDFLSIGYRFAIEEVLLSDLIEREQWFLIKADNANKWAPEKGYLCNGLSSPDNFYGRRGEGRRSGFTLLIMKTARVCCPYLSTVHCSWCALL